MIEIKKLHPKAKTPTYATEGSAGLDLYACHDTAALLRPNATFVMPTGIALSIPRGFCGMIVPRSGLGVKYGVVLGNGTGIIDSDFHGELHVCLWNRSDVAYSIAPYERIAQMMVIPVVQDWFKEVEDFSLPTERDTIGFGSTGKM